MQVLTNMVKTQGGYSTHIVVQEDFVLRILTISV